MQRKKIVFLASDCESSRWVYHALSQDFEFAALIIEEPVSRKALFSARLKKIGFFKVAGQVLFSVLVVPFLKRSSRNRKAEIMAAYGLQAAAFDTGSIHRVPSVNDDSVKVILAEIQPDIVVVNGTRIISRKILGSTNALFVNMHAGITPWYRGSHGGYWALYNQDAPNFRTTIHLIDAGIDTGAVLKQAFIQPGKKDNFATFPVLQTAIGIQALKDVLTSMLNDSYEIKKHSEKGKMYHQPTIWQYFLGGKKSG